MKKTVLITGASSGIGRELAAVAASYGNDLVIIARRIKLLKTLKDELKKYNVNITIVQKDLSKQGAGREIYDEIKEKNIEVDYLINNAGFGDHGLYYESDWDKKRDMINVNVVALSELTRFFLTDMVQRESGKILNIASGAGFLPGPLQPVYYATKAFVVSFSLAIAEEVRDKNITVSVFCPAATNTGFVESSNVADTKLFKAKMVSAEKTALLAYRTMLKGKLVSFYDKIQGFFLSRIIPLLPGKMVLKISRSLMEKE